MQRTLQIFVNNRLYKELTVETNSEGQYDIAPIWAMIDNDRHNGYFDSWNIPPGTFPVRVQLYYKS